MNFKFGTCQRQNLIWPCRNQQKWNFVCGFGRFRNRQNATFVEICSWHFRRQKHESCRGFAILNARIVISKSSAEIRVERPTAGFYRLLQPNIRETIPMELHWPPRQERVPETPVHMEGSLGKTAPSHTDFRSGGLTTVNCGTSRNVSGNCHPSPSFCVRYASIP